MYLIIYYLCVCVSAFINDAYFYILFPYELNPGIWWIKSINTPGSVLDLNTRTVTLKLSALGKLDKLGAHLSLRVCYVDLCALYYSHYILEVR